jgi:hypothetical protein
MARRCFVDVVGPGLTPARVLERARDRATGHEFFARFHDGLRSTVPLLLAHQLDVGFGRYGGLTDTPVGVAHRLVRWEPMALLLPEAHQLAGLDAVPLARLRGTDVCWLAGDHASLEWEQAAGQLLSAYGAQPGIPHPHVRGADELAYHVKKRNVAVLTVIGQPAVPGAVVRPLVEPVAVYPWSMVWRRDLAHPGLRGLHDAIDELAADERWLAFPADAWLPDPEASAHLQRSRVNRP